MTAGSLLPHVPDLETYRSVRGDPALWLPAFEAICARHGIDARDLYAERTGSNMVFRAGQGPWIKLFPPLWGEDFVRERTGLAAMTGEPQLAIPQLLHQGVIEDWPYLVLSHIEGAPIGTVWRDIDEATQIDLARQIGELLARMHAVDATSCDAIAEDWPTWTAEQRAVCVERQRGHGLPAAWCDDLAAYVDALPPMADANDPLVFLHADVTDEHVFVQRVDGRWRVTGLIDFGDAMVGDRLYDFAAPLVFLGQRRPGVQRALLAGYGWDVASVDEAVLERMTGWCLLHRWGRVQDYAQFTPGAHPENLAQMIAALRPRG